ncbi:hypothetical protein F1D97_08600 [Cellulomonas palmilytica]|nr:hypothetical protein F1D97_08600 [Cellulomonas palmilytica]
MDVVPALERAVETKTQVPEVLALVGVLAVIGILAILAVRRNTVRGRTHEPLPDVVHALAERGYLAFEPYDDDGTPEWLLHRRRLPDRNLSSCEHDWYFAIFGTRLASCVVWSEVRPPTSAS